jgi:hypothetical protein
VDERGSATPLLALVVVLAGGLCLVLGRLGGVAHATAQAQTAADAAALAAAADDADAGRAMAQANGARIVRLDEEGDEVEVAVRIGDVAAVARAAGRTVPGASTLPTTELVPELRAALARAEELLGSPIPITSGWRSRAEQQRLYDDRDTNPYPVARPGMSAHERGRAVDVARWYAARLAAVGPRAGLCRPWPESDPVHFELCRRPT